MADTATDRSKVIGTNLRYWRTLRVLNQDEVGAAIGVSGSQVQKYETGENRVAAVELAALAERLEVPVEKLYEGIDGIELAGDPHEIARIQRAAGRLAAVPEPFRGMIEDLIGGFHRAAAEIAKRQAEPVA